MTVTTAFSEKVKINPGAAVRLPMKTVGGTVQATLGAAGAVAGGNAEPRSVHVAVIQDSRDPAGPRVDGLFRMSFLARLTSREGPTRLQIPSARPSDGPESD